MRTISAAAEKILASGNYAAHVRVSVKEYPSGDWKDMTTLAGNNWLVSASWSENIDQPIGTASIELARRIGRLSLATLDEVSKLNNVTHDGITSFEPLLLPGREVKIETAISQQMAAPSAWIEVFWGEIERVSWDADPVRIECRDMGCKLQRSFIEHEWIFAAYDEKPIWTWEPNTNVATARDGKISYVLPSKIVPGNYLYETNSLGVTGTTEPAWRTDYTPFSDGTHTWVNAGAWVGTGRRVDLLIRDMMKWGTLTDFNYLGPYSTGTITWTIKPYRQDRVNLLEACRTLAAQIGFDFRLKWQAGEETPGWRMSFQSPARTKTTADRTFSAGQYRSISSLELGREGIRNVVRVVYSDASTVAANGVDKVRKSVQVTDSASIARYGRAFCEIAESSTSQIDTSTEATALANAVLSDLSEPEAEKSVTMGAFPFVELGDLYTFAANGVHYSSDLKLAVVGFSHKASRTGFATTLLCRGKVSGGYRMWHKKIAPSARKDLPPSSPASVSVTDFAGMSVVSIVPADDRFADAELYIGGYSGFTPASATLYARGRQTRFSVPLSAGTYYARVIIRDEYGNASQPSAEVTLNPS